MRRSKIIIGGLVILAAFVYLIISTTFSTAQYFLTVQELKDQGKTMIGKEVRISGAVIGDTIHYDPKSLQLSFSIADLPGNNQEIESQGGIAKALHEAVTDAKRERLQIIHQGPKPDLLRDEAQAILTGKLDNNGTFLAESVLLKCPTKYKEALPQQSE